MEGCTSFYIATPVSYPLSFYNHSIYGNIFLSGLLFFQNVEKTRGNIGIFFPNLSIPAKPLNILELTFLPIIPSIKFKNPKNLLTQNTNFSILGVKT